MTNDPLQSWAAEGLELQPQAWDQMPDIYLYMDQVVTCLQGMLKYYDVDPQNPLITNSMVNNYVKCGAVERPVKKKYSREHLAKLYIICLLKPVLSLQDIYSLLQSEEDIHTLFETFAGIAAEASREESRKVQEAGDDPRALWALAMQLSAESAAKQVAARRIIETLAPGEKPAPNEKEKAAETDGPKENGPKEKGKKK